MESIDYSQLAAAIVKLQQNQQGAMLVNLSRDGVVETGDSLGTQKKIVGPVAVDQESKETDPKVAGQLVVNGDVNKESVSVGDGVDDAASSTSSESSTVSGGGVGTVSDVVKRSVTFGGESVGRSIIEVEQSGQGFFADFVRGSHATALFKQLRRLGVLMPKASRAEVAYCSYSSGTMPAIAVSGKSRLRGLAVVGDAAITMHLVNLKYHLGENVESMQAARSRYTSDSHFVKVMDRLGLLKCISFPPGVDPRTSKVGATAFEALIGVMSIHMPASVVMLFLDTHKVFV